MDGIGCWELTKNQLALSASVQALSDHEDVERQLLTVLEEDSDIADDEDGHLGPVWPAELKEGLNEDIRRTDDCVAAITAAAAELAELPTNDPQPLAKRPRGCPKKVSTVCSMP